MGAVKVKRACCATLQVTSHVMNLAWPVQAGQARLDGKRNELFCNNKNKQRIGPERGVSKKQDMRSSLRTLVSWIHGILDGTNLCLALDALVARQRRFVALLLLFGRLVAIDGRFLIA
jgi:hypothetical protein